MVTEKVINSKKVFISEKHHYNLIPWANIRKNKSHGLNILCLDHHIDNRPAFLHYAFNQVTNEYDKTKADKLLVQMSYNNVSSIEDNIINMKNDEHIDIGIKLDIISKIFIICFMDCSFDSPRAYEIAKYQKDVQYAFNNHLPPPQLPVRPYTYPESNAYTLENICYVGCKRQPHDDDCQIIHFNQAINSILLNQKLDIINEMTPNIVSKQKFIQNFILDIDLDYFHTKKSIFPNNIDTFYGLIHDAESITIAKESEFIEQWSNEYEYDKELTVDFLLESILKHIYLATKISC